MISLNHNRIAQSLESHCKDLCFSVLSQQPQQIIDRLRLG
nr:MAG TPA: hypothetical protein [Caudoviricetes sp.]